MAKGEHYSPFQPEICTFQFCRYQWHTNRWKTRSSDKRCAALCLPGGSRMRATAPRVTTQRGGAEPTTSLTLWDIISQKTRYRANRL